MNAATTSILWAKNGVNASSTSHFANASTTLQTTGTQWFTGLASSGLGVDANGKVYAAATSTLTNISGTLALTQLTNQNANTVLANATGGSAAPTAVSTTSLFAGTHGQVLAFLNGGWIGAATTTFSGGLTYANGAVTCDIASGSVFGCLSTTDWNTFNNKQAAGNYITALTGDVTASGPGSASVSFALGNTHWWTARQNFGNASTSQFTATSSVWFTSLGTPAGTFLAVDPNGLVIATTTPAVGGSGTVTNIATTYPITGGPITTTGTLSLAFGTTTTNTWAHQIFSSLFAANASTTNATTTNLHITGLANSGLGVDANGKVYAAATSTLANISGTLALTQLANQNANTVLANATGASAAPTAIATSSFFGTGTAGHVLAWSGGVPQWIATTTLTNGAGITTAYSATNNQWTITNTGALFGYPFTSGTTFATSTAATTTSISTQGVFFASSTAAASQFPFASSTAISVSGTASTTNLTVSGLNAANCDVKASAAGVLSCGVDATGLTAYDAFTHQSYASQTTSATSTTLWLTGTTLSLAASSTFANFASSTNASTTFLTTNTQWFTGLTSSGLGVDANGKVYAAATSTLANISGTLALTQLANQNANTVLANATGASAAPTAIATSSFFGTGTAGHVLAWSGGVPQWIATTTLTNGAGITTTFSGGTWTIANTGATFAFPVTLLTTFATSTAATTTSISTQGVFFASSTAAASQFPFASSTAISVSGTASTTNLTVSGLNAANCDVKASAAGVLSCGTDATGLTAYDAWTHQSYAGLTTSATSSTLWLTNTTLSLAASSSILTYASTAVTSSNIWLTPLAAPAGSFIAVDAAGKIIATSTPAVGGGGTVTNVTGANGITGSVSSNGALSLISYLATSSSEVAGNLSYWTTTNGNPARLGTVATTSLTASGVLSLSNPISVIGGSASALTLTGGTGGQVLGWAGGLPAWVATTTFSTGLTYAGGAVTCDTASGSTFGCLSAANWTTFNGKQPALGFTPPPNTRAISTTYPLQGGGDLSADRLLSLAFGTTTTNTWAHQIFSSLFATNASTTNATTTNLHITSLANSGLGVDANGKVYAAATSTLSTISGSLNLGTQVTGNLALSSIAQVGANSVLVNNTSALGNVTAIATTSFFGTGIGGQVLAWSGGVPSWIATTTLTNGTGITTTFSGGTWTIANTGANFGFPFSILNTFATSTAATTTSISTQGVFFASSTAAASQFPFASSTALTAGTLCISTDCRTAWPTGGGSGDPFTHTTYNGQSVSATTSTLWLTGSPLSLIASSSFTTFASTTNLTTSGSAWFATDANSKVGIGSSTPSQLFTVSGTSSLRDLIPEGPYTTNLSPYSMGDQTRRWSSVWAGTLNIGTSTFSLKSDSASSLGFFTAAGGGGTQALTITSDGKLGIGTSTPSASLTIQAATNVVPLKVASSSGATLLQVNADGSLDAKLKQLTADYAVDSGSQSISAGDIVSYINGKAEKAKATAGAPAAAYSFASSKVAATALDSTHFVLTWVRTSNSDVYAIIGTVSGTSISYGSATLLYATTAYDDGIPLTVAALSSTKFVVAFYVDAGSDYPYAVVASLNSDAKCNA